MIKHFIGAPVVVVLCIGAMLATHPASAATRTWTGGSLSTNNWTDAANWGGTAPVTGDDLVFPGGAARPSNTNDFAAATSFNSITFNGASGGYTLGGNAITLVAGITTSNTAGFNVTTFPVTLSASQGFNLTAELDLNGPLAIGANTLTVTCGTATSFFQNVISGNGAFIKNGPATLVLSGLTGNTFSGTTTVNAGTLRPDKAAGVGAIAGPVVVNGGNLQLGDNEQIVDTVSVTVTTGTFNLAGFTETIASLTGAGTVNLGGGSLIVSSPNISFFFSGVIAGTGGVSKTGLGTFQLTGANTYSGPTNVTGGQLFIGGGSLNPASAISVTGGGAFQLANAATVGPITAGAATISLGGGTTSDGTATNVALAGTTTFFAQILGTAVTDYSRLTVTGTLNLGGAALSIYMPGPFFSSTGQSFMIINKSSAGAVTGTFNGLPQGGTFTVGTRTLQISYVGGDGNDVVLTDIGALGAGEAIPTLGLAGLVAFAALLLGLGLLALRRA